MKRIAIALAAFCLLAAPLQAQNLGGLLSKIGSIMGNSSSDQKEESGLGAVLGTITDIIKGNTLTKETFYGTWTYTSPAVSFKSDKALASIASAAAQGTIEKKLGTYFQKVGITEGMFGFTFNEDGTMTMNYGSKTFTGTWSYDAENAKVTLKLKQLLNIGVSAYVDKSGDTLSLIFDTTAVMKIIKSINSVYNNSTLSTIASILNQYDEMYAGFRLKK